MATTAQAGGSKAPKGARPVQTGNSANGVSGSNASMKKILDALPGVSPKFVRRVLRGRRLGITATVLAVYNAIQRADPEDPICSSRSHTNKWLNAHLNGVASQRQAKTKGRTEPLIKQAADELPNNKRTTGKAEPKQGNAKSRRAERRAHLQPLVRGADAKLAAAKHRSAGGPAMGMSVAWQAEANKAPLPVTKRRPKESRIKYLIRSYEAVIARGDKLHQQGKIVPENLHLQADKLENLLREEREKVRGHNKVNPVRLNAKKRRSGLRRQNPELEAVRSKRAAAVPMNLNKLLGQTQGPLSSVLGNAGLAKTVESILPENGLTVTIKPSSQRERKNARKAQVQRK
ncbi:hypothetical protein 1 [Sanxia tombus-like virus 7]|uniref:hypothetical protein 1 n=1 Tax=Sanxia tombus-like virus 7 TaxID=1923391 RepID=UPI00090B9824|nr:hypothetical protein 1 [Sanxia tombus-like virus 7]APG76424.1 hypothetical protein 1 [Sanxia tombus-like virus 7]